MSNSPSAPATPRWFFPWWLPGVIVGTFAACITFTVLKLSATAPGPGPKSGPPHTHKAEALLQVPPNEPEGKRKQRTYLLKSRDLLTRVLGEPAVASLSSVRAVEDPLNDIEARLAVAETGPDVLSVTLTGNDPDDIKVILDHLVKRFVDDEVTLDRHDRDDRLKKLEQFGETLRLEIEAMEKQIELIARANGTTGGEGNAKRLAELQRRQIEAEVEIKLTDRELLKLEAELVVLKKQQEDKNPPDLAREARIAQLATMVEIKKELRAKLKEERDALQKLILAGVGGGVNIDALQKSLQPQRDALDKVNTQLAEQRLAARLGSRLAVRGAVTVAPVAARDEAGAEPRDYRAVWLPAVAFASGFALATGLSLVGLVFQVLRRKA